MTMETQAMTVRLPQELYERLRREAFEKRVSQNSIIIDAIEKRLENDGKDPEPPSCDITSVTPQEFDELTRRHGVRWEQL